MHISHKCLNDTLPLAHGTTCGYNLSLFWTINKTCFEWWNMIQKKHVYHSKHDKLFSVSLVGGQLLQKIFVNYPRPSPGAPVACTLAACKLVLVQFLCSVARRYVGLSQLLSPWFFLPPNATARCLPADQLAASHLWKTWWILRFDKQPCTIAERSIVVGSSKYFLKNIIYHIMLLNRQFRSHHPQAWLTRNIFLKAPRSSRSRVICRLSSEWSFWYLIKIVANLWYFNHRKIKRMFSMWFGDSRYHLLINCLAKYHLISVICHELWRLCLVRWLSIAVANPPGTKAMGCWPQCHLVVVAISIAGNNWGRCCWSLSRKKRFCDAGGTTKPARTYSL